MGTRMTVISIDTDRVTEFSQDAQEPQSPERSRVLVGPRHLMVDVENHRVGGPLITSGKSSVTPPYSSTDGRRPHRAPSARRVGDATMRRSHREGASRTRGSSMPLLSVRTGGCRAGLLASIDAQLSAHHA